MIVKSENAHLNIYILRELFFTILKYVYKNSLTTIFKWTVGYVHLSLSLSLLPGLK